MSLAASVAPRIYICQWSSGSSGSGPHTPNPQVLTCSLPPARQPCPLYCPHGTGRAVSRPHSDMDCVDWEYLRRALGALSSQLWQLACSGYTWLCLGVADLDYAESGWMWEQDRERILGRGRVVGSGSEGPWALACTGQTNKSLSPNSLVLQGYLVGGDIPGCPRPGWL